MEYKKVTLSNLATSTAQEVFDHVVNNLQIQNERSAKYRPSTVNSSCFYRLEKDNKVLRCAAGCLIADDEYSTNFENELWSSLVADKLVPPAHDELIANLQGVHDCSPVEDWRNRFVGIAKRFNLDPKVIV